VPVCSQCGQAFDGNQCWVCVARMTDVKQTLFFSLPVAIAGIIGTILVSGLYPPLMWNSLVDYMFPTLFLIPAVIVFVLVYCQRLTRYAALVRLIFVLVAAAFVVPAAFYFLNGALDHKPPVEVQALVSSKYSGQGRNENAYGLIWTLSWNGKRIEQDSGVSREIFSATDPGDSVRVVVHPGTFSTPWYGKGILSNSHDAINQGRNRQ
jgi:hypothetical protein